MFILSPLFCFVHQEDKQAFLIFPAGEASSMQTSSDVSSALRTHFYSFCWIFGDRCQRLSIDVARNGDRLLSDVSWRNRIMRGDPAVQSAEESGKTSVRDETVVVVVLINHNRNFFPA